MFFRSKRRKEEQTKELEKLEYEAAIERLHIYGRTSLAIARISHWEGYNVRGAFSREPLKSPDDFLMNGVVHEETLHTKRILCEVRFSDEQPGEAIGSCVLTHIDERIGEPKPNPRFPRERQRMLFQVWIADPNMEWRQRAYETVRNAAASNAQFCHFNIETEKLNGPVVVSAVRENGDGPSMKVLSLSTLQQIVLPKAPEWGWRRYTEFG